MMPTPVPQEPIKVALIGAGARAQTIYRPLFRALAPWITVVAVCDPVQEHCNQLAAALGAPAFYTIRELVKARPMEAALVVTPIDSHHSISIYLSSHGIHNLTETTWASMVCQAQQMIAAARQHNVIVRVAENFFRFPIDRFAQQVQRSGYLGRIGRIFSYADHTGYHNNSRWIAFAGNHPLWVQCVEHAMPHPAFYSMPQRRHETELLNARFFMFRDNFLVIDTGSGHVKGHLGRHPRPGYTEWQGERGALVHRAMGHTWGQLKAGNVQTELRRCSDDKLAGQQEALNQFTGGGIADQITPVTTEMQGHHWLRTYAETPAGPIEYINPFHTQEACQHSEAWYCAAIMDHISDFALAVRGLRQSEFNAEDALMAQMMEIGAHESALQEGRRIKLPLEGDLATDALKRQSLQQKYGVDPLDIEAMLAISYPRP